MDNKNNEVVYLHLDDIIPNRFQPRLAFDEQGLKELSNSIKEHGIIQPLVLRKLGNKYEIIAGERRYKAATMAGLVSVPAVISNIDDNKSAEVALVENVQRRDLTPIEEARSYKNLLDKGYLTQEQLAKKMGLSQPAIANKLRLLNLDEEVQQALMNEKISERHARALLTVDDKEKQKYWLHRIINERLTVRQLDLELKKDKESNNNGTIPVIDPMPSIEEIKNQAQDINPNRQRRSVESMMVPENIMTEFSGALPIDVVNEEKNNQMANSSNLENFENQTLPQPENKFFNFGTETAANMDTGISMEPTNENMFQVATPEPITENSINTVSAPPTQELETLDFDMPTNNAQIIDTNQPISTQANMETITASPVTINNSKNIGEAVNIIRTDVNNLQGQGYNINIEEFDLGNQYQINIKIDK